MACVSEESYTLSDTMQYIYLRSKADEMASLI